MHESVVKELLQSCTWSCTLEYWICTGLYLANLWIIVQPIAKQEAFIRPWFLRFRIDTAWHNYPRWLGGQFPHSWFTGSLKFHCCQTLECTCGWIIFWFLWLLEKSNLVILHNSHIPPPPPYYVYNIFCLQTITSQSTWLMAHCSSVKCHCYEYIAQWACLAHLWCNMYYSDLVGAKIL